MSIFVAGASGTIGIPLVRALVAAKLPVTALTRSTGKQAELRALGASVRALDAAPAGATYDIVDDRAASMTEIVDVIAEFTHSGAPRKVPGWLTKLVAPYMARMTSIQMPLSNAKAKAELGWRPKYATMREGLADLFHQAA